MSEVGSRSSDGERLGAGYSGRMLFLVVACTFTAYLGWLVIPPLLPAIIDDLGISPTQAGFGLTVLSALAALGRYPGGRLADRLSRKTVITFAVVVWVVGFLVLAGGRTYGAFLLGTALVGVALGAYVPATYAQLSDLFDRKRGRAFGLNNAAVNLSGILASVLAIVVLAFGPWQFAFVPIVVVLLGILVGYHRWSRERLVLHRVDLELGSTITRLLLDPRVAPLVVVAALFSFVWTGSISFLPVFLGTERGLTTTAANAAFATVFLVGVFVTPLAGAFGDRFGSLRAVLVTVGAAILGLSSVVVASSTVLTFLGVAVFAAGLTGFWPVMTTHMMGSFPDANRAGDYGAVGTVYMGAGSVGPTYVGYVGEHLHYTAAYAGLAGCLVLCLVLVLWMRRS